MPRGVRINATFVSTRAATRAVHLEVVSDLTTHSFVQAFWRFTSHKSLPKVIISDKGTTCIAAASHLKKFFNSSAIQEKFSNLLRDVVILGAPHQIYQDIIEKDSG